MNVKTEIKEEKMSFALIEKILASNLFVCYSYTVISFWYLDMKKRWKIMPINPNKNRLDKRL